MNTQERLFEPRCPSFDPEANANDTANTTTTNKV